MKFAQADGYSGFALGALGAYIIVQASSWEYLGPDGPGPGFFPLCYGIAMVMLSLALVVSGALRKAPEGVDWRGAGRALSAWLAFAAALGLLKFAGFLASFAALTFFIVAVMYRRPVRVAALVAAASAAAFYLVFPLALGVRLP